VRPGLRQIPDQMRGRYFTPNAQGDSALRSLLNYAPSGRTGSVTVAGHAIAVYGATGHTAQFVRRELERRGCSIVLIARQPPGEAQRESTQWRRAQCDAPDALDHALEGASSVINCAGPFADTAPALAEAALRRGIHYLDITAEQRSVRQTLATYHDEARARGVVIVPAMAFYGGLADLLATAACSAMRSVESIEIGVALDYWHPTRGTRSTGERNTARRLIVSGGRLEPLPSPAPTGNWSFPEPFGKQPVSSVPLSEIILISKHIAAARIRSFMNDAPLGDLGNSQTPPPTAQDASGRSSQRFFVDVVARGDRGAVRIAASGRDIYAVSAPLVVEACLQILQHPPRQGGTYAPGEIFDPKSFLGALSSDLKVTRPSAASVSGIL